MRERSDRNMAKKHHAAKKDLARSHEWGGYSVSIIKELKELGDVSPLLEGLPDNMCHAPHWGYVFKGKMVIKYKDREETITAGDAYYMEPGHVPIYTEEGTEYLIFSPKKEVGEVMAVWEENLNKGITAKKPE
jgi:hypothetical protein